MYVDIILISPSLPNSNKSINCYYLKFVNNIDIDKNIEFYLQLTLYCLIFIFCISLFIFGYLSNKYYENKKYNKLFICNLILLIGSCMLFSISFLWRPIC